MKNNKLISYFSFKFSALFGYFSAFFASLIRMGIRIQEISQNTNLCGSGFTSLKPFMKDILTYINKHSVSEFFGSACITLQYGSRSFI